MSILNSNGFSIIYIQLLLANFCSLQYDFHDIIWSTLGRRRWIFFYGFNCGVPSHVWQWDMLLFGRGWLSSVGLLVLWSLHSAQAKLPPGPPRGLLDIRLNSTVLKAATAEPAQTLNSVLWDHHKYWHLLACLMLASSQPMLDRENSLQWGPDTPKEILPFPQAPITVPIWVLSLSFSKGERGSLFVDPSSEVWVWERNADDRGAHCLYLHA